MCRISNTPVYDEQSPIMTQNEKLYQSTLLSAQHAVETCSLPDDDDDRIDSYFEKALLLCCSQHEEFDHDDDVDYNTSIMTNCSKRVTTSDSHDGKQCFDSPVRPFLASTRLEHPPAMKRSKLDNNDNRDEAPPLRFISIPQDHVPIRLQQRTTSTVTNHDLRVRKRSARVALAPRLQHTVDSSSNLLPAPPLETLPREIWNVDALSHLFLPKL